jgi:type I restriction enzyme S subunit
MEVKPGYKMTEVGVIPEDWDAPELSSILASTQLGGNYRNSPRQTDWPLVKMGNLGRGKINLEKLEYIDYSQRPSSRDKLEEEDLLFNTRNTLDLVGKVALWRGELSEAYFNSNIMRMVFDNSKVTTNILLSYILNTPRLLVALRSIAIGTTSVAAIYNRDLIKIRLPLPPKGEQETIASALSDVDNLIESLEQLIAKKWNIKQGAMQELLTGKRRLPGFCGKWVEVSMRDLLHQNATYGIVTAGNFVSNGIKMLRGGDIDDGQINIDLPMVSQEKSDEYSRTVLAKDDVVIALVGYPGSSAKIPDELIGANISRAVGLLRFNKKASSNFLVCFLNSTDGRKMVLAPSAGSAQKVVNLTALNKLRFIIPPIDEQIDIASVLCEMDAEIAAVEAKIFKARQLKQAMMQELLTGRIRLV